ncbi:hypothetical protein SAMN04487765_3379 [Tenacibaculum sp. MAR_2010_89]|nr:hypothetical protein SAMN04487765_3379 [Tenacibaculum sp. MAR_2010_89]
MSPQKYTWKREYTLVLVANLVYLVLFYIITNIFNN